MLTSPGKYLLTYLLTSPGNQNLQSLGLALPRQASSWHVLGEVVHMRASGCLVFTAITAATALRLPGGCRPARRVARRVPGWAAAMCTDSSQSLPQLPEKVEAREAGAVWC